MKRLSIVILFLCIICAVGCNSNSQTKDDKQEASIKIINGEFDITEEELVETINFKLPADYSELKMIGNRAAFEGEKGSNYSIDESLSVFVTSNVSNSNVKEIEIRKSTFKATPEYDIDNYAESIIKLINPSIESNSDQLIKDLIQSYPQTGDDIIERTKLGDLDCIITRDNISFSLILKPTSELKFEVIKAISKEYFVIADSATSYRDLQEIYYKLLKENKDIQIINFYNSEKDMIAEIPFAKAMENNGDVDIEKIQSKDQSKDGNTAEKEIINPSTISKQEFDELINGMSYDEVVNIIGGSGELIAETGSLGDEYYTAIYMWSGEGSVGANANITFQDGKMQLKAQAGLN